MKASDFLTRARVEVSTPKTRAIAEGARRLTDKRLAAAAKYPAMDEMRDRARAIRLRTLANLDTYLDRFATSAEHLGAHVYFADDADDANGYISTIATRTRSKKIVKSKSMVTEEIGLNEALAKTGCEVVETDLGEFIVQLSGDKPSHIIAPVLHKTRFDIGRLFASELSVAYTDDPVELNQIARAHLREIFLQADMGVSGVNFGVASSGSVCTVTNEGNGRLTTTAPRVHVAVMGMERLVPDDTDLAVMLEILPRSATGQALSVYTNIITGPRRPGDPDGPEEVHIVILDNGRSSVLSSSVAEILACIRCGACLNVCPVYREVGGHTYDSVYSGPVGSVLTPALVEHTGWTDLPFASTLCGACREACPVRIDIPRLLAIERAEITAGEKSQFAWLGIGLAAYTRLATNPRLWGAFMRAGGALGRVIGKNGWIGRLPFHASAWTDHRDLPTPTRESFRKWWRDNRGP